MNHLPREADDLPSISTRLLDYLVPWRRRPLLQSKKRQREDAATQKKKDKRPLVLTSRFDEGLPEISF